MGKINNMPDLNLLAMQVHANSKQHGFWEGNPSNRHFMCLVVCELAEAVEAHRSNRNADYTGFETTLVASPTAPPHACDTIFRVMFRACIKDTVADELADAVIRLLDLAGANKCNLTINGSVFPCMVKHQSFTENIWHLMSVLTNDSIALAERIMSGIISVQALCTAHEIDLWWHVEQKMRYNANRPYKHGKEY